MNRNQGAYEWFTVIVVFVAFASAIGWGIYAMIQSLREPGPISFGSAVSLVGVYFAFGVHYSVDYMRRRTDRAMNARFDEVLDELKKRECKCQADCCDGADAKESEGRSWFGGLLRRWVGR